MTSKISELVDLEAIRGYIKDIEDILRFTVRRGTFV
jgi:hypothetical protein